MAKPAPIEYKLKKWSIVFIPDTFKGELHPRKDKEFIATVEWEAWTSEIDHPNHRTNQGHKDETRFATFGEAKNWIDEQIKDEL